MVSRHQIPLSFISLGSCNNLIYFKIIFMIYIEKIKLFEVT